VAIGLDPQSWRANFAPAAQHCAAGGGKIIDYETGGPAT